MLDSEKLSTVKTQLQSAWHVGGLGTKLTAELSLYKGGLDTPRVLSIYHLNYFWLDFGLRAFILHPMNALIIAREIFVVARRRRLKRS